MTIPKQKNVMPFFILDHIYNKLVITYNITLTVIPVVRLKKLENK